MEHADVGDHLLAGARDPLLDVSSQARPTGADDYRPRTHLTPILHEGYRLLL